MYKVTYMTKEGEIKSVNVGNQEPNDARAFVETVHKDCAYVMHVTNIYSGHVHR